MDANGYLERIRYQGSRAVTAETLRRLHRAHMLAVPFENLDIHLGVPIVLSEQAFHDKIVGRRRGGFCYELNGLFAWLLGRLGFRVRLLSGRVFTDGGLSPEFDHMLLLVELDERWIADVGFGDSFLEPLPLDSEADADRQGTRYSLVETGGAWTLRRRRATTAWEPQYAFSLVPRRLDDFAARCVYQQTSPESHFTQGTVCSLATERGRVTLSKGRFIITEGEQRDEREVRCPDELRRILASDFGMELEPPEVDRLMLRSRGPATSRSDPTPGPRPS
jgi:N-hydroxyarylamine O-acetyltransferase